ncbi:hypothetical protein [Acinetobacter calcoaceticus]|jgi:hypothetical protein|uniref:hypothetical protein n=1 Tax=Acinetobacter calcoaceticus TaxID=471 RepID=UPI0018DD71A0|nr:hypothetical protein [Acinetobacter calcoaceticus]
MSEFFFSTRFCKRLPSSESDIKQQLNTFKEIVEEIAVIDPIFSKWYVNNPTGTKPPLDYPFPSQKADSYLYNLRKEDNFQSFSLWNGEDNSNFSSINFDTFDFRMSFEKVLKWDQAVQLFKIMLDHLKFHFMYLNNDFFADINVFPHRLVTTPICYIPIKIKENDLPYLYKKIEVDNQLNQGTILVFDEKWTDETDELKKKVQENSIALVELGAIPEAELPEGFFD